jgi:hypothetical protein
LSLPEGHRNKAVGGDEPPPLQILVPQELRPTRFALAFFFVLFSPKLMDFANKGISIIGSKDGKTRG